MASKIAQGGETANQAYMATVAGLANMDDEVARNQAGVALFGTMWEDLRDDVVLAMSDSTDALGDYKGATEDALNTLNSGPIARMKNAWRDLTTQLASGSQNGAGKEFLDGLATTAEKAVPVVLDLADKAMSFANTIRDNWGPISSTVLAAGAAVGTFKLVMTGMTIVGTVTKLFTGFTTALKAGTVAQWAFTAASAASPLTWIALGMAAVVAAGVLLWKNWDTVKIKADELWTKTKEVFGSIYDWASAKIQPVTDFFGGLKSKFDSFKSAITSFKLPDWVTSIGSTISGATSKVKGWFGGESYAVGSNRITHDQVAQVHKDEMIIPARQSAKVRAAGGTIDNIDKLITGKGTQNTVVTTSPTDSSKGGITVIIENITATGVTVAEVVGEIVPKLKLALANM